MPSGLFRTGIDSAVRSGDILGVLGVDCWLVAETERYLGLALAAGARTEHQEKRSKNREIA
jgi:hypothetical protein